MELHVDNSRDMYGETLILLLSIRVTEITSRTQFSSLIPPQYDSPKDSPTPSNMHLLRRTTTSLPSFSAAGRRCCYLLLLLLAESEADVDLCPAGRLLTLSCHLCGIS